MRLFLFSSLLLDTDQLVLMAFQWLYILHRSVHQVQPNHANHHEENLHLEQHVEKFINMFKILTETDWKILEFVWNPNDLI